MKGYLEHTSQYIGNNPEVKSALLWGLNFVILWISEIQLAGFLKLGILFFTLLFTILGVIDRGQKIIRSHKKQRDGS